MLWVALRFASLPLDVYARAARASHALAVATATGSRSEIIACNPEARRRGVYPGMSAAAASVLAADLQIVARDVDAENGTLERIATWAIQFTPTVSISAPSEVLLEIAGSLSLFGGLTRLWNVLSTDLRALGFDASIAGAPTPLAAQWFARAGLELRVHHADALRTSIEGLPLAVMQPAAETFALLRNIGAKTVGDCLALPRDGMARRFGQALVDDIDRALGKLPDPRAFFTPPHVFRAAQPLPAPAHESEMLLFAAHRLLVELCAYLAATANGIQRLTLSFSHHGKAPTRLTLSLVSATRNADHLTNVLRERLERTALPCPATDIELESELLLPLASSNLGLLPDAGEQQEAAAQLIERLRARLGDGAVLGLKRYPDHRPEHAWRTCEPGSADTSAASLAGRPLLLLREPRALAEDAAAPCYEGRLTLVAGPERIESGWWDGNDVTRDYFVASNAHEALLWIYRERGRGGRWFLHGFFA